MKKIIELHKRKVEYTLKVSRRARRMRLVIFCDGNFVVTVPEGIGENSVEKFIVAKSQWIIDKLEYFKRFPAGVFSKRSKRYSLQRKREALELVEKRVSYFNQLYGFKYNNITIRNQKTRWGSCSKKGNLNFNYKITSLPQRMADYIVVHELCHLGEFNHSQNFWNLVARTVPDYLQIRREIRKECKL